MNYSIQDLDCANTIVNNPSLYDMSFMTWALEVISFFRRVHETARKIYNHKLWDKLTYGDAIALVWANLKNKVSFDAMVWRPSRPSVEVANVKDMEKCTPEMRSRAGSARNRVWSGHTPLQTKHNRFTTDLDAKPMKSCLIA